MERDFIQRSMAAALNVSTPMPVLIGTPIPAEDDRTLPTNGVVRSGPESTSITNDDHGRIVAEKQLLPTYDVFDEARYFAAKNRSGLARSLAGMTLGVTVCEDAWQSAGMTLHPMPKTRLNTSQNGAVKAWTSTPPSIFQPRLFTVRNSPRGLRLLDTRGGVEPSILLANQVGGTTIFSLTAAVLSCGLTVVPSLLHRGRKVCWWLIWTARGVPIGWRVLLTTPCASEPLR